MEGPALIFDRLHRQLAERAANFPGVLAASILDLSSEERIDINASVLLGCGSSIKIPILMELIQQHDAGLIDLDEPFPILPRNRVGGAGVLQFLSPDLVISGRDLATAMIVLSDNVATNCCIDLVGLSNIQALLKRYTPECKLERKMQDYRLAAQGVENVATAAGMAEWIRLLHTGQFVSRAVSDEVLRVLSYRKAGLLNQALPGDLTIANKPGGLNGGKSDVGIVYQARRPYIISLMTAFVFQGNGMEAVMESARLVHEHMAVLDKYKPVGVPQIEHFLAKGSVPPDQLQEQEPGIERS